VLSKEPTIEENKGSWGSAQGLLVNWFGASEMSTIHVAGTHS